MMTEKKIVGLVPAAGFANRLPPIPCSKEIYPIGFKTDERGIQRPEVISESLLSKFREAGAREVCMIIRKGKWDIPGYYGTGKDFHLNISYLVTDPTPGTPFTIDKAYPFIRDKHVLFGFPDIYLDVHNPFTDLMDKQNQTNADIVLGLFKARNPAKMDMVEINRRGKPEKIIIKPERTQLIYTWLVAVWNPAFTRFIHDFLMKRNKLSEDPEKNFIKKKPEIYVGDIIQEAIQSGLNIESVHFHQATYTDIGTIGDLKNFISRNK